ncbi:MAG: leucyl aminopeptidase [Pseudomonadota bacterium]
MSTPLVPIGFEADTEAAWERVPGTLVVFATGEGTLTAAAEALDGLMQGALSRAVASDSFKAKAGTTMVFAFPGGLAAEAVVLACLGAAPDRAAARKTGGAIARALRPGAATLAVTGLGAPELLAEMIWASALRLYEFREYKGAEEEDTPARPERSLTILSDAPEALARASGDWAALAEGVFFTRDLVNEPANRLTTDEFAARLAAMQELGLEVEILGEEELTKLGARALLGVGQGSTSESKMVIIKWSGGAEGEAPLALIGKGVVFDTGGISLKPASGMEDMTMDMGGAGVVAGVMRTLALRKAKANVIGAVGLVENMPSGNAQRPGDIVRSMKGDTIEVINTDAEGRLVLADVLWHVQEAFKPAAMIDLATLTGAAIIALGHHNAAYFATDDALSDDFAAAAKGAGDPAWRMPLGPGYAKQIKSRLADIKNTGGRSAGSITAAEFLHRFVKPEVPWIHIDIAGVTTTNEGTDLAPKGATGWGVAALDELVREKWEG